MSAEYEGWTVWCDYVDPSLGESTKLAERLAAQCKAVVHFDQPGVTSDSLYEHLDKAGWTGDDHEHDYCPEHPLL